MAANEAPGRLRLVQDFVNTLDVEEREEKIGTPEALGSWLAGRELLAPPVQVTGRDHARALELREALRRLLLANNGAQPDAADLEVLNCAAADCRLQPRFGARQVSLEPATVGVDAALGRLLAIVSEAMAEGTWQRLKACAQDRCMWAFYDRSKNHSGHWCTMAVCGNRAKARQFRERRRRSAET